MTVLSIKDENEDFQMTGMSLTTDVEIEFNDDDYDSDVSFSKRGNKAEQEKLSGETMTQDEFLQRIRARMSQQI